MGAATAGSVSLQLADLVRRRSVRRRAVQRPCGPRGTYLGLVAPAWGTPLQKPPMAVSAVAKALLPAVSTLPTFPRPRPSAVQAGRDAADVQGGAQHWRRDGHAHRPPGAQHQERREPLPPLRTPRHATRHTTHATPCLATPRHAAQEPATTMLDAATRLAPPPLFLPSPPLPSPVPRTIRNAPAGSPMPAVHELASGSSARETRP